MPLTPLSGALGTDNAAHLLRRTAFGATKKQIDEFAALTVEQAMDRIFIVLPDPSLPIDTETGETWIGQPNSEANSGDNTLQEYFKRWYLGQMMSIGQGEITNLPWAVREKIVWFLHTHFTTKQSVVRDSRMLFYQNALFRFFAFDELQEDPDVNFKTLTVDICIDNAMLRFLDGRLNVKGSPNENFARELFELYTIGRGLEGTLPTDLPEGDYVTFTEQDVQAAALVLTGFDTDDTFSNIDELTGLPLGKVKGGTIATAHDNNEKTFSARFNNQIIGPDELLLANGRPTYESAYDEIKQLIDMIYDQEETARHICRRLYRFYVNQNITQELDNTIIAEMATTFRDNGFRLDPVLKDLWSSEHFFKGNDGYMDDKLGALIKSPLDILTGTKRSFSITLPDYMETPDAFYEKTENYLRQLDNMGLNFYEPFEVAGYSAYHQFPHYHRNWISTNYLTQRYDFIRDFIENYSMEGVAIIDFVADNFPASAPDAKELIMAVCQFFLPVHGNLSFDDPDNSELSLQRLSYFLEAFIMNPMIDADPEASWTFRWNNRVDDEVVVNQLNNLFNAVLQSPEYQLK